MAGANLTVTKIDCPSPAITCTLDPVQPGKRYLVKIQPASTAQPQSVVLSVVTDYPPDAPKRYPIFVRIK